jgi:hypothetical protein
MSDKRVPKSRLAGMDLEEAIHRLSKTDTDELAAVTNATMKDGEIEKLIASFEEAVRKDTKGEEFWFARDLQKLLGYDRWENFLTAIGRAKIACENSGQLIADHFRDVTKMIELAKGAIREIEDFKLGRYACYLITQNSDARKKPVAFGQTYFAIQTRRQELSDAVAIPSSEDEKRVYLRNQIKEHNRYLSSAAKDAGVVTPQEFAIFHSKGYQGRYGKTVPEIRRHRGLAASADILDRMGSTELAANFFRVTQTEEKLRNEGTRSRDRAYATHYAVGRQVRDAMLKISGTAPEDLPVVDNISKVEKRLKIDSKPMTALVSQDIRQSSTISTSDDMQDPSSQQDDRHPINLRNDLWKFALLLMAAKPTGIITTSELIDDLPNYIQVPEGSQEVLIGRTDSKFSQLVRNLKSHKSAKTNFVYQGYAEIYEAGFKITDKGLDFVKSYFSK